MISDLKVSIIVPIYNTEKYLDRCIQSILKQTYTNIEIILVNDGSTDESFNICQKYKNMDERVFLINDQNHGAANARNLGISMAKGDYIAFIDSDDYVKENFIANLVNETDEGRVDLIISGYTYLSDRNTLYEVKGAESNILFSKEKFMLEFENLLNKNLIQIQCNKLIRTMIAKQYKVNVDFISGEDYLFNLDILSDCKLIKVSSYCDYIYVNNVNGVSNHIKVNYSEHYELNNQLKMKNIERDKLLKIGFSFEYIYNFFSSNYLKTLRKVLRNIALQKCSYNVKKEKYKDLLKCKDLQIYIKKNNVSSSKDLLAYYVYASKSIILLRIFANLLKIKSLMKG